jgi:hypothetical protein
MMDLSRKNNWAEILFLTRKAQQPLLVGDCT